MGHKCSGGGDKPDLPGGGNPNLNPDPDDKEDPEEPHYVGPKCLKCDKYINAHGDDCPICSCKDKITLNFYVSPAALMEECYFAVEVSEGVTIESVEIGMRRTYVSVWTTVGSGENPDSRLWCCSYTSRNPGSWQAKATVVTNLGTLESEIINFNIEFPRSSTILAAVRSEFNALWQDTKTFATNNRSTYEIQEYGAWVWVDTEAGKYYLDTSDIEMHKVALVSGVKKADVISYKPRETDHSSDPTAGGKYYVAHFHTHYPICYAQVAMQRKPCGPSDGDKIEINKFEVPGFVYDYSKGIDNYHKIDAAADVYTYGVYDRRDLSYF